MRFAFTACLILALLNLCAAVKRIPLSNPNQIEGLEWSDVEFVDNDIIFVTKDMQHFGYVSKKEGEPSLFVEVEKQIERILDVLPNEIVMVSNHKPIMKHFKLKEKKLVIQRFPKKEGIDKIINLVHFENSSYLLTEEDLRVVNLIDDSDGNKKQKLTTLYKEKIKGEKFVNFLPLFHLNAKTRAFGILSEIQKGDKNEACLIEFQNDKPAKPKCISLEGKKIIRSFASTLQIILQLQGETLILNNNFQVLGRVEKKILQSSPGYVMFQDGTTFNTEKEAIYQSFIVGTQGERKKIVKVEVKKENLILFDEKESKKITQIERVGGLKPNNVWIDSKLQDLSILDVVIQWEDLSVAMYQVRKGAASEIWRRK